ncbi:MAG TPA: hypothetical protein VE782_10770 [Myxococcaceae bacterium]|nr:hypothetical protein [Myxococcaceae bacterium]
MAFSDWLRATAIISVVGLGSATAGGAERGSDVSSAGLRVSAEIAVAQLIAAALASHAMSARRAVRARGIRGIEPRSLGRCGEVVKI